MTSGDPRQPLGVAMPTPSSHGMQILTLAVLPVVAVWLGLRGLIHWAVRLPRRLASLLDHAAVVLRMSIGRVAAAVRRSLGPARRAVVTLFRPVRDLLRALWIRVSVLIRAAARRAMRAIAIGFGTVERSLRALSRRFALSVRQIARLVMGPIRSGLRSLIHAARASRMALAGMWIRSATMAGAVASMLATGVRRIGHAIRHVLARLGVVLREIARGIRTPVALAWSRLAIVARAASVAVRDALRQMGHAVRGLVIRVGVALRDAAHLVATTLRPVGRTLRSLATRALVLLRESCRAVVRGVRLPAQALVHGLVVRARDLVRGAMLIARLGWAVTKRLIGRLTRRLDVVLRLVGRVAGACSRSTLDVVLTLVSWIVRSLMPIRVAMGEATRLLVVAIADAIDRIVGLGMVIVAGFRSALLVARSVLALLGTAMAVARRRVLTGLRVAIAPVVIAWLLARQVGRPIGRAMRRAAAGIGAGSGRWTHQSAMRWGRVSLRCRPCVLLPMRPPWRPEPRSDPRRPQSWRHETSCARSAPGLTEPTTAPGNGRARP